MVGLCRANLVSFRFFFFVNAVSLRFFSKDISNDCELRVNLVTGKGRFFNVKTLEAHCK